VIIDSSLFVTMYVSRTVFFIRKMIV